jgi:hypothetical protein
MQIMQIELTGKEDVIVSKQSILVSSTDSLLSIWFPDPAAMENFIVSLGAAVNLSARCQATITRKEAGRISDAIMGL